MMYWDVMPPNVVHEYQHVGETICFRLLVRMPKFHVKFWHPSTELHRVTSEKIKRMSTGVGETSCIRHALALYYNLKLP